MEHSLSKLLSHELRTMCPLASEAIGDQLHISFTLAVLFSVSI